MDFLGTANLLCASRILFLVGKWEGIFEDSLKPGKI